MPACFGLGGCFLVDVANLGEVRVTPSHWQTRMIQEIGERREHGTGQFRDSTQSLNSLLPQEIAVVEVYDRRELIPFYFDSRSCAVIAIWTKEVVP